MYRSNWITCIGATCVIAGLLAGVESGVAQTSEKQHPSSGGTQGLQEQMYEERMKELQQNQSGTQQTQRKEDQSSKGQGAGTAGTQSQGGSEGHQGSSGHTSGRTDR